MVRLRVRSGQWRPGALWPDSYGTKATGAGPPGACRIRDGVAVVRAILCFCVGAIRGTGWSCDRSRRARGVAAGTIR